MQQKRPRIPVQSAAESLNWWSAPAHRYRSLWELRQAYSRSGWWRRRNLRAGNQSEMRESETASWVVPQAAMGLEELQWVLVRSD